MINAKEARENVEKYKLRVKAVDDQAIKEIFIKIANTSTVGQYNLEIEGQISDYMKTEFEQKGFEVTFFNRERNGDDWITTISW